MTDERYIPQQLKNPVLAIREHCLECMGGTRYKKEKAPAKLVDECTTEECALWEFREGINPYRKTRKLSDEHKLALQS